MNTQDSEHRTKSIIFNMKGLPNIKFETLSFYIKAIIPENQVFKDQELQKVWHLGTSSIPLPGLDGMECPLNDIPLSKDNCSRS